MISLTPKNYKKLKAKKMRIGGEEKKKEKLRTIDLSELFACHRKGKKIGRVFTNTALQNYEYKKYIFRNHRMSREYQLFT